MLQPPPSCLSVNGEEEELAQSIMVSFFGIKFGSDRKKARDTSKRGPESEAQKWPRIDDCTLGSGQYFGHNFSRPQPHRPGTSYSSLRPPQQQQQQQQQQNWRAVFSNHGLTASMSDLAPPRLRQHASAAELHTRFANGSTASLAPHPLRQHGTTGGADIHPAAELRPVSRGGVSVRRQDSAAATWPADASLQDVPPPQTNIAAIDFPSPPRMDHGCFSSPEPACSTPPLDAVSCSAQPSSCSGITSTSCKRETFAFHQPRRPTITLPPDEARRIVRHTQQPEGFCGNFADFDFGEGVAKPAREPEPDSSPSCLVPPRRVEARLEQPPAPWLASSASAPSCLRIGHPMPSPPTSPSADDFCSTGPPSSFLPTPGFTARLDSLKRTRAPPPLALRPCRPLAPVSPADANKRSPYGPPTDTSSTYIRSDQLKAPRPLLTPRSPLRPRPDAAPRSLSRPRLAPPLDAAPDDSLDSQPAPSCWPEFDAQQPRRSAIPPPLATPNRSPALSGASSATSAIAPRLPSPSFPALAVSFSKSSNGLAQSLELCLDGLSPSAPRQMQLTPESAAYIDVPKSPGGFI
ncbi:hypothetical protein CDD81_6641 [Ophiocordyceps australis]|uniref:Uncharacterized protein n=1 Tax=Ophiocordyceps australis TaxID=1399860 RepID=A0A2C5Y7K5_9HYPO|nr:hypothetical protein CDD81_6641 [Ophiocordyceps australis]